MTALGEHPVATLEEAVTVLEERATFIEKEQAALRRFQRELRELTPAPASATGVGPLVGHLQTNRHSDGIGRVETAYQETLGALDGGIAEEEVYRDMAIEFGTVVETLADAGRLTPMILRGLDAASKTSREDRSRFLERLRREQSDLESLATQLDEIIAEQEPVRASLEHATRSELTAYEEELDGGRGECLELLDERQATIQSRGTASLGEVTVNFNEYIYADSHSSYPALTALMDTLERCEQLLARVDSRLS